MFQVPPLSRAGHSLLATNVRPTNILSLELWCPLRKPQKGSSKASPNRGPAKTRAVAPPTRARKRRALACGIAGGMSEAHGPHGKARPRLTTAQGAESRYPEQWTLDAAYRCAIFSEFQGY